MVSVALLIVVGGFLNFHKLGRLFHTELTLLIGGYPKFVSQGFNENYLPIWLQAAGYKTYYVGKLFNAQTVTNFNDPYAAGWTGSDFLLDPYTYRYLNATFQRNYDEPVSYEGQYATDVLAEKAYGFLDDAVEDLRQHNSPFFLTVAPTAPHSDVNIKRTNIEGDFDENTNVQSPPIPASRHKDLFEVEIVPRTPNFNPDHACGVSWISRLPKQNQTNVDFNDEWHRNRLRALQAVDEMIDSLVEQLDRAGVLEYTYIFYSSDNGYTIGQHRRQPGKQCAFEQDINVPLLVRGPGIKEATETNIVTSHIDLAPTLLRIAGAKVPDDFVLDGQAIPMIASDASTQDTAESTWRHEHVNVEMWGIIMSEGKYGMVLYPNHTYKALRIESSDYRFLYTVWCSGEHELYDMTVSRVTHTVSLQQTRLTHTQDDPYQLDNHLGSDKAGVLNHSTLFPDLLTSSSAPWINRISQSLFWNGVPLSRLVHRLDALLMVLKTCTGRRCTHPWATIFPSGEVENLMDALDESFDEFFETRIEKVKFESCEKGYIPESEGPVWDSNQVYGMFEEMAFE
jgi:arylsulfatase A-like enzyme